MGFTKTQHDLWKKGQGYQEYLERVRQRIEGHPGTVSVYSAATGKKIIGVKNGVNIEQITPYRAPVYKRSIRW